MAVKMTYAVAIDNAINGKIDAETIERLEALKAQLAKRNGSGKKGLTKAQKENVGLKNQILEVLGADGMTATEVGGAIGETCQRASALLNQLVKEGLVQRDKEGRKTIFRPVAEAEVEDDLSEDEGLEDLADEEN